MRPRIRLSLAVVACNCIAVGTIALADEMNEKTGGGHRLSSLDPLAKSISPNLSQIAEANAAESGDLAAHVGFAELFCPVHQRFESQAIDLSQRRDIRKLYTGSLEGEK